MAINWERWQPWAPLALRLAVGVIMAAHGAQKMLGWFDGPGFQGTAHMFEGLGLKPGILMASLGGGGELLGGVLIFFGLFTRFGAFLIAATMTVAICAVSLKNGLFDKNHGYEYPLSLLAAGISLICSGGGILSLDSILRLELKR